MKVKELISELYRHDPDADLMLKDVTGRNSDESYWLNKLYFNSPSDTEMEKEEGIVEILAAFE